MLDAADAPGTDQESGAARLADEVPPGVVAGLAGLDAPWTPADASDAKAALLAIASYCRDFCPVVDHCVEGRCRLYRLEGEAARFLTEGPDPGEGVIAL